MTDKNLMLKAGKLHLFTTGEYSDYHHTGAYVALCDLTVDQMKAIVVQLKEENAEYVNEKNLLFPKFPRSPTSFDDASATLVAALIKLGLLLEVSVAEVHVGSYSELNPSNYGDVS